MERSELLDDLYRGDMNTSDVGLRLLERLLIVREGLRGNPRFDLTLTIAAIQLDILRYLAEPTPSWDWQEVSDVPLWTFSDTEVSKICGELESDIELSYSPAWKNGVLDIILELRGHLSV